MYILTILHVLLENLCCYFGRDLDIHFNLRSLYTGKYTHTFIGDLCKQQHCLCHTGFGKYVSSIDKWALQ